MFVCLCFVLMLTVSVDVDVSCLLWCGTAAFEMCEPWNESAPNRLTMNVEQRSHHLTRAISEAGAPTQINVRYFP